MRHRKSFNHLSRKVGHRRAMLANMASSLIKHKRIETTTAKAKALRSYIEPLITKAKDDTTHSRRMVFRYLQDKDAVSELFREVAKKIADRPGGYTRIIKLGSRLGDSAEMAIIELVDYNQNLLRDTETDTKKSGSRRRRRGGGKSKSQTQQAEVTNAETTKAEEGLKDQAEIAKPEGDDSEKENAEVSSEETKNEDDQTSTVEKNEVEKKESEPTKDSIEEGKEEKKEEISQPEDEAKVNETEKEAPKADDSNESSDDKSVEQKGEKDEKKDS